jgi:carbonic anhydrase
VIPSAVFLAVIGLCGCGPAGAPTPTVAPHTPAAAHWSYEGESGPAHWGSLSPDYVACSAGASQSPINIVTPAARDLANPVFHYQPTTVNITNNGHTIQVNYDPGSYIELDGARYDLTQFHFHSPSEHMVNGKLSSAEVHLVHIAADGKLAVVGLLVESGVQNAGIDTFWSSLPATSGPVQRLSAQANAADMLPAVQLTYRYVGSLTTPPCTEGVKWAVMVQPIQMSDAQLAAFRQLYDGNNRPGQPLNGRVLIQDTTP